MKNSFLEYSYYAKSVNSLAAITHPDIATLVDPLFAARKEGKETASISRKILVKKTLKSPLYAKGEERVVERSKDRVSKICERTERVIIS